MKNERLQRLLRFVQWISLTFILVLAALMVHDTIHRKSVMTVTSERLNSFKSANLDDPKLLETIRDLDYLYRATYFQTQDRQSYGFLLLGIAFMFLCVLLVLDRYRFKPELKVPENTGQSIERERKELLIYSTCGIVFLTITLLTVQMMLFPSGSLAIAVESPSKTPVADDSNVELHKVDSITLSDALEEASHQWPQFRGSILPNQNSLPEIWRFNTKWTSKISMSGFNSPVVWDNRIFLAGGNQEERAVFCFDTTDGKELWKAACTSKAVYPELSEDTGVSAPTVCVDKQRVYVIFATGEMLCCDHEGKILWQKQLPTPDIMYGYASSPLLLGDRLIVQYDLDSMQTLYAFDVVTGKDIWKSQRQSSASWSSPVAMVRGEQVIIFVAGNRSAEGIDASTGDVLWKKEDMGGEVATSAIVHNNTFYFSNAGAITAAFKADTGEYVFKNDNLLSPDVASPVLINETLLLFTSGGSVIGVSADKGEECFEYNFDNGFYASPVVINNKVVAVNLDGDLFLLNASTRSLTIEGKFSINKKVVSIPAFHHGNIIIRTVDNDLLYLESAP